MTKLKQAHCVETRKEDPLKERTLHQKCNLGTLKNHHGNPIILKIKIVLNFF
jgi:hypothetical protein